MRLDTRHTQLDRRAHANHDKQAWIEASTKGAVLLFTASEIQYLAVNGGFSPASAGLLGGMGGGIVQGQLSQMSSDTFDLIVSNSLCYDGLLHLHGA